MTLRSEAVKGRPESRAGGCGVFQRCSLSAVTLIIGFDLIASLICGNTANAESSLNVNKIGFLVGGAVRDIYVVGNYGYVATEEFFSIIDISDPSVPVQIGYLNILYEDIQSVYVVGDFAYIVTIEEYHARGLHIIDISEPSSPFEVGYYAILGSARCVFVAGNYAYIADYYNGLLVIDISVPSCPRKVVDYVTPGTAQSVFISDNYAYIATNIGLRILDITTPSLPMEIGYTTRNANDVYIQGNYAYVAGEDVFHVIDISNPSSPNEIGYYDTPGNALGVYVSGNYAYVANDTFGLRVIDVSNPSSPDEIGYYDTPGNALGVHVSDNYAYVADDTFGLRVIDVSNPSSPDEIGYYATPLNAESVYVSGNYAYVADDTFGLRVIDVSILSSPNEIGYCDTPGNALGVYVSGNYAYVADAGSIQVIDVSIPLAPSVVGYVSCEANYVQVFDNYAYTNGNLFGFKVVDVSIQTSPSVVGGCCSPNAWGGIHISGNYAYVGGYGLNVIDISNPTSPVEVGHYDTPGNALGVYVSGNYAYVADERDYGTGLRIFDISTPETPSQVGYFSMWNGAQSVFISNNYAYVAGKGGLRIIDVTTPSSPVEVGHYNTLEDSNGLYVYVNDNTIYMVDNSSGFYVLEFVEPDITPPIQNTWNPLKYAVITTTSQTITFTTDENADCKWSLSDLAYDDMTGDCTGDGTMSLSCAAAGFPEGEVVVYISCRDMAGNKDTADTNEHLDYTVNLPPGTTIVIEQGWNLVGISKQGVSINTEQVFGDIKYEIVSFTGGVYETLTGNETVTLDFARGYWIYSEDALGEVNIVGTEYPDAIYDIDLTAGWNLFANPFNEEVSWTDDNAAIVCGGTPKELGRVYYYNSVAGYYAVEPNAGASIKPWMGYWIQVEENCKLIMGK